jgi:hypothetical protein
MHLANAMAPSFLLEHSVEIAAPGEVVWEVITDFARYPDWNPFVVECRSSLEIGAPIAMRVRVFPFWAQPQRERILEHDPSRRLCYGVPRDPLGALESRRCHAVRAVDALTTRYDSRFELRGWLAPVVRALLGRRLAHGFAAMTEALRARADALHAGRAVE